MLLQLVSQKLVSPCRAGIDNVTNLCFHPTRDELVTGPSCPLAQLGDHRGVLYHTPETSVEGTLEDSLTDALPNIHKIQRIKLKAKLSVVRT